MENVKWKMSVSLRDGFKIMASPYKNWNNFKGRSPILNHRRSPGQETVLQHRGLFCVLRRFATFYHLNTQNSRHFRIKQNYFLQHREPSSVLKLFNQDTESSSRVKTKNSKVQELLH